MEFRNQNNHTKGRKYTVCLKWRKTFLFWYKKHWLVDLCLSLCCCNKITIDRVTYKQQKCTYSPRSRKSKIKVLSCLMSLYLPLSFCCVLTWQKGGGRSLGSLSLWHKSHSWGSYPHDLITFQRPHLLISSHWGLGLQHRNFGGTWTFSLYQFY